MGAVLATGLGLAAADKDDDSRDSKPITNPWWHGRLLQPRSRPAPEPESKKEPKKEPKKSEPDKDKAVKKGDAPAPRPTKVDEAVNERAREEANLLRRLRAVDRLKEIAFETHDDKLERLAEQLEERAQTTYSQRIAHLPASGAGSAADDQILEKHLTTTNVTPTASKSNTTKPTASATSLLPGHSQAALSVNREGKP
jgi:hypothetical protein